ncbi:MAG: DedA family protein [Prevotella sp.]|jgi:membrane protein DedA with SNARE-associated domain
MNFLYSLLSNINYLTIFILMMVESTVIPFPSEVVVPPAAYNAAGGSLNVILVVLFATLGADVGAAINYAAGYFLGRPVIYRFANSRLGHLCLLNEEKIKKSEKYFNDHGFVATITGRLIPGIRQLISVPAGLAKMNFWKFILYTTLGSGAWNCILAALGWYLHSFVPADQLQASIQTYSQEIKIVIVSLAALGVLYLIFRRMRRVCREKVS